MRSQFRHQMIPWGEMDTHHHAPGLLESRGTDWAGRWPDHVTATYKPIKTAQLFRDEGSVSKVSLVFAYLSSLSFSHFIFAPLSMVLGISCCSYSPQASITTLLLSNLLVFQGPAQLLPPLKISLQNKASLCSCSHCTSCIVLWYFATY